MRRRYALMDVFTDKPLTGAPLAVVRDANGLDASAMQAVAAEFGLSETVFVLPAENHLHSAALRIFNPTQELPFAGHPTIGAAVLLGLDAAREDANKHELMLVLEETVGPVRCGVWLRGETAGHAIFDLPRLPLETRRPPGRAAIAAALGLTPMEIGFENHQPICFSAGLGFLFVPVRDLSAVARARAHAAAWPAAFGATDLIGAFVYCRETAAVGRHFHARMFAPDVGVAEDPATGSAVAAFAGVIRRFETPPAGSHRYFVEQGFEMGRPSLIGLEIDVHGDEIQTVRIGGDAVVVAEGTLNL